MAKDDRLVAVEEEEKVALNDNEKMFNDITDKIDDYYKGLQSEIESAGASQAAEQQKQTDFAIQKINQQKEQANKDYIKEQSGAYVDWQKQSNEYGANAEQQASMGLANTGYSESSQVSMYNTYQNRVATARDVYNRAILEYDNAIQQAKLQNSSILAEIASQTMIQKLEIGLQGFQYMNDMLLQKVDTEMAIKNMYHGQYMDVLDQINAEKALEIQQNQYQLDKDQFDWEMRQKAAEAGIGAKAGADAALWAGINTKTPEKTASGDDLATMRSIYALENKPISVERLDYLVRTGQAEKYTEDGVEMFRKPANTYANLRNQHTTKNSTILNAINKLIK